MSHNIFLQASLGPNRAPITIKATCGHVATPKMLIKRSDQRQIDATYFYKLLLGLLRQFLYRYEIVFGPSTRWPNYLAKRVPRPLR